MEKSVHTRNRHPDSLPGNALRKGNRYRMRIWSGEKGRPDPEDDGEVVEFVGYFDKSGTPAATGSFLMADLTNSNYVCRVIYRGKTIDVWGDRRIWWTDQNPTSAPNRVTFLEMPVSR
ncbi:hypothetical protein Gxy13693_034_015 [Komagataeibacter xylinus NBRC 13693]|uniref:Uncharacterized protein n=2 Tax=Komagataeibacter TaxID=1434011 RepID=A0A0D6QAF5_KOMXY|nr:hypothetical protein Gxy13693_034_015 [Komagataeibacter xylinus NBRC 13693]